MLRLPFNITQRNSLDEYRIFFHFQEKRITADTRMQRTGTIKAVGKFQIGQPG